MKYVQGHGGIGCDIDDGSIDATITTTHSRDRNGRLTKLEDARGNQSTFEYDTLDRRTKLIYPEGETHLYTYNPASDLIAETDPNATEFSYTYDRLSRRTEVRVDLVSPGSGVINTAGPDPVQTFAYDGLDRVTAAVDASAADTGAAAPDDDNRVTDYVHFRRRCVEERDPRGGETHDPNHLLRQYVWGDYIDELIQQREYHPGDPDWFRDYYLLSDLHFRAVALTDRCGGVVEGYETDAYGRTHIACDAFDAVRLPVPRCAHLFTGRYLDAETGLHYFRARHYHPALGRFMQRDPKGYEEGANLYAFADSNPAIVVDPLGKGIIRVGHGVIVTSDPVPDDPNPINAVGTLKADVGVAWGPEGFEFGAAITAGAGFGPMYGISHGPTITADTSANSFDEIRGPSFPAVFVSLPRVPAFVVNLTSLDHPSIIVGYKQPGLFGGFSTGAAIGAWYTWSWAFDPLEMGEHRAEPLKYFYDDLPGGMALSSLPTPGERPVFAPLITAIQSLDRPTRPEVRLYRDPQASEFRDRLFSTSFTKAEQFAEARPRLRPGLTTPAAFV